MKLVELVAAPALLAQLYLALVQIQDSRNISFSFEKIVRINIIEIIIIEMIRYSHELTYLILFSRHV